MLILLFHSKPVVSCTMFRFGTSIRFWIILVAVPSFLLARTPEVQNDSVSTIPLPSSQIELKTYVESSRVPLNRPVVFHVELSWIGDMGRYNIEAIPLPVLTNLTMEGSGSAYRLDPLGNNNFRSVKSFTYQFRPLSLGMAYIDGLTIKYTDSQTGKSDALYSQRMMIEIVDPLPENSPGVTLSLIYLALLTIFALTIFYFVIRYIQKRRAKKKVDVLPQVSPAEEYLKQLSQEIDPKGTNLNEMTNRLLKLFREFLQKEFHLSPGAAAGKEVCNYLAEKGINEETLQPIRKMFEEAEVVIFGGSEIQPDDFSRFYTIVENFLKNRKEVWEAEHAQ